MKTAHETSKGSEVKCAWRWYAIWWLDALALLAIMLVMSVRKAFLQQTYTHQMEAPADPEDHDADWVTARPVV
jgi:hypothetical protein